MSPMVLSTIIFLTGEKASGFSSRAGSSFLTPSAPDVHARAHTPLLPDEFRFFSKCERGCNRHTHVSEYCLNLVNNFGLPCKTFVYPKQNRCWNSWKILWEILCRFIPVNWILDGWTMDWFILLVTSGDASSGMTWIHRVKLVLWEYLTSWRQWKDANRCHWWLTDEWRIVGGGRIRRKAQK